MPGSYALPSGNSGVVVLCGGSVRGATGRPQSAARKLVNPRWQEPSSTNCLAAATAAKERPQATTLCSKDPIAKNRERNTFGNRSLTFDCDRRAPSLFDE